MEYYVYVVKSLKIGYRYIGHTNDLKRRLSEHNEGLTKSIKFQRPFELLYFEKYSTKTQVVKREKFLKSGKGRQWLDEKGIK